jgi:phosphotransferase system  glucose/maltose/N-acetylglucosamine-specific IIC component
MISWLVDTLPWWSYVVFIGGAALLTMPWWLPVATAIWNALPSWARFALGGFLAVFIAYIAGRNRGKKNAEERQRANDAKAHEERRRTEDEVSKMGKDAVKRELDKWNRD